MKTSAPINLTDQNLVGWLISLVMGLGLLLFLQTFLAPVGLAVIAGGVIWLWWRLGRSARPIPQWTRIWGLVSLMGLGINVWMSQSWPISLAEAIKWMSVILVWWSAMAFPPKPKLLTLYWLSFLVIFSVIGMLALLAWFVPAFRLLPDTNFLYATYGHNHFAVILLMILPWLGLAETQWPSQWWRWLSFGWLVWLISTFGRMSLLVGGLELWILEKWWHFNSQWRPFLRVLLWGLGGIIIAMIIWSATIAQNFEVNRFSLSAKLVKPFQSEPRPEYFRQAFEGLKQYPVIGVGLGLFYLISFQSAKDPFSISGFVHNDYLQWLVEAGWWGLFMSGGAIVIWWQTRPKFLRHQKPKTQDWFYKAVWLTLGALGLDAFVDFNLQFTAILLMIGVGLGWLGAQKNLRLVSATAGKSFFWFRSIILALAVVVMGYGLIFSLTDLAWRNHWWRQTQNFSLAQKLAIFPAHNGLWLSEWQLLSTQQRDWVIKLIWHYPLLILKLLTDETFPLSFDQKLKLGERLYELQPWSRTEFDLAGWMLAQPNLTSKDLAAIRAQLHRDNEFFIGQNLKHQVKLAEVSDITRWRLARNLRYLAELEILGLSETSQKLKIWSQLDAAIADLVLAWQQETWVLAETVDWCHNLLIWSRAQSRFDSDWAATWSTKLMPLDEIPTQYFGSCGTQLTQLALEQLTELLSARLCLATKSTAPDPTTPGSTATAVAVTANTAACQIWLDRAENWSDGENWANLEISKLHHGFPNQN